MARSAYLTWLADSLGKAAAGPVLAEDRPQQDLVVGYATGYAPAAIAPFVRSLRAVFDGAVALVVDDTPEMAAFLEAHDVEALFADGQEGWKPHAVVERFAGFAEILGRRPWVRNVLMTDVRDVVFQRAPFHEPMTKVEFFEEYDGKRLSDHAFNSKHLKALGGEGLARSIQDRSCICVGTVAGPRDAAMAFCRAVLLLSTIPRSEVGGAFGADQAACNIVAHMGLVDGVVRPNYSRVATIGLTPGDRLRLVDEEIVNPDGGVSPVVHQYDRHPELVAFVQARWSPDMSPIVAKVPKTLQSRARRMRESLIRRLPEFR